jgi:hypothetical protein
MNSLPPTYRWLSAVVIAAMLFGIAVPVVQHACMAHGVMQGERSMHQADAPGVDGRRADVPGQVAHHQAPSADLDAARDVPHASKDASHDASHDAPAKPCCCDDASSPCTTDRSAPAERDLLTGTTAPSGDLSACCAEDAQVLAILSSSTADRLVPLSAVTQELSGLDAASSLDAEPRPVFASLSDDPSPSSVRLHVWTATFLN